MTAEEIKVIEFKIDVVKRCRVRVSGGTYRMSEFYFRGMEDAFTEILQEFGGIGNGEKTGKW